MAHALLVLGGIWMAPGFMCPKKAMNFFHMNKKQQVQNTLKSSFKPWLLPDAGVAVLSVL